MKSLKEFILEQLDDTGYIHLSRNELASFFNCAPSQINYVLETRFTLDRGFSKESKRGGGGFIKISKDIISHLKDDPKYKDVVDRLWELTFEM